MNDEVMSPAIKRGRLLGSLVYLLASAAILLLLAYFVGGDVLTGSGQGGRTGLQFARITWLNQYFPSIPDWYPREGGGVPLLQGFQILAYLVVIAVHRLSGLSLWQAFNIVRFLLVYSTALGVYLFGWVATKKQTVGLVAAVFFLVTPACSAWMVEGEAFPEASAMVWLPVGLACLVGYLEHRQPQSHSGARRIWFVGLALSVVFAALTDLRTGQLEVVLFLVYAAVAALLQASRNRGENLIRAISGILMAGLIVALVLAPLLATEYLHRHGGTGGVPVGQVNEQPNFPSLSQVLGLDRPESDVLPPAPAFPLSLTVLFGVGLLLSALGRREVRPLYVTSVLALAAALVSAARSAVGSIPPGSATPLAPGLLLHAYAILLPVGAAVGLYTLVSRVVDIRSLLRTAASPEGREESLRPTLRGVLAATLTVGLAAGLVRVGPGFEVGRLLEAVDPVRWPGLVIGDAPPADQDTQRLVSFLTGETPLRVDVSPHLDGLAGELIAGSDATVLGSTLPESPSIGPGWAYRENVLYSRELGVDELGNPRTLNGTAQWFGTEYVFISPELDRSETYQSAGWEPVHLEEQLQLWHNPEAPGLASIALRPAVLVTDVPGRNIFMAFFRLANDGLLPYQEAFLVESHQRLDQFSLEELKPFDALMLVGYDYRSSRLAWETVGAYVEQGGSVFVDTGWQFVVPEWEFDKAPDVLPVARLTWTDYGMTSEYSIGSWEVGGDIDAGLFKPLVWEGEAWRVSGANAEDIRSWGQVVLSAGGRPLIVAGRYGQGRVVWSGMNLIGHALYLGKNDEEIRLLHNLLNWLIADDTGGDLGPVVVSRDDPDRVELRLPALPGDGAWLYWREAYHPDWHAFLSDSSGRREIPIFRAGPGLMLMPIEADAESVWVSLVWEPSTVEKAAIFVSVLGSSMLIALFVDGLLLGGNAFTWLKIVLVMRMPRPFLAEGSNVEWAEKKQAELAAQRSRGQRKADTQQAPERGPTVSPAHSAEPRAEGNGEHPMTVEMTPEIQRSDDQDTLLRAWLNATDHQDDGWAEKIIGRKRADEKRAPPGSARSKSE